MFIPDYFKPWELVGPQTYKTVYEKGLSDDFVYCLMDSRLLRVIQYLRRAYGPMIINNWYSGGERKESGLRVPGMTHYSDTSQHAFGRAVDALLMDIEAETVRQDFRNNDHNGFLFANDIQVTLESDVTWLHIDVRNNDKLVNFFKAG